MTLRLAFLTRHLKSAVLVLGAGAAGPLGAQSTPVLSGNLPLAVDIPASVTTPVAARPSFDTFSWQSFIALNWPAIPAQAGVPMDPNNPATFNKPPKTSQTVWESYAESFQLFGPADPEPWGSGKITGDPCAGTTATKTLRKVAKGTDVLDEVNEAFSHPLIDQNLNYVYAEVRFNQAYYDFVRSNKYFLKANLPGATTPPMSMPESNAKLDMIGAVMIKAAWRILTDKDDHSRYHAIEAAVLDPGNDTCTTQTVGLVGLHIAQKVKDFPQWIWSSFEQVDNIERGRGASADTPISFNNGTDSPPTPRGWANRPPQVPPLLDKSERIAVQVTRVNPIPTTPAGFSTVDLNIIYQGLLAETPFANYQLVITQWPTVGTDFKLLEDGGVYPADSGQPFPVNGATNTAMETFLQSQTDAAGAGGNSCMQCHYGAGTTDFSWILQNDSH